ncbi:hypothetical protein EW146_g1959 [Bondarzewia mesenterica]|uniref:BTB domain-containing protein n=1 Tax=Bondarzewia mesenterica TaxID=1095465 RepID=A0A4S4M8G9_9AGAM|nr:hypothetical protein EW146_g1959 [Bondarzewia mesenterica]
MLDKKTDDDPTAGATAEDAYTTPNTAVIAKSGATTDHVRVGLTSWALDVAKNGAVKFKFGSDSGATSSPVKVAGAADDRKCSIEAAPNAGLGLRLASQGSFDLTLIMSHPHLVRAVRPRGLFSTSSDLGCTIMPSPLVSLSSALRRMSLPSPTLSELDDFEDADYPVSSSDGSSMAFSVEPPSAPVSPNMKSTGLITEFIGALAEAQPHTNTRAISPIADAKPIPTVPPLLEEVEVKVILIAAPGPAIDIRVEKHKRFFFEDGNVTFLINTTLYRVHQYFFTRDSSVFSDVIFSQHFERCKARKKDDTLETPIHLKDIEATEFDAFLSILYPSNFDESDIQAVEGWSSVLHLATVWKFASMRRLAIQRLTSIASPIDRLVFGHKYAVEDWIIPAYVALCERTDPLDFEEGWRLPSDDIILIARVREEIRSGTSTLRGCNCKPEASLDSFGSWKSSPVEDINNRVKVILHGSQKDVPPQAFEAVENCATIIEDRANEMKKEDCAEAAKTSDAIGSQVKFSSEFGGPVAKEGTAAGNGMDCAAPVAQDQNAPSHSKNATATALKLPVDEYATDQVRPAPAAKVSSLQATLLAQLNEKATDDPVANLGANSVDTIHSDPAQCEGPANTFQSISHRHLWTL